LYSSTHIEILPLDDVLGDCSSNARPDQVLTVMFGLRRSVHGAESRFQGRVHTCCGAFLFPCSSIDQGRHYRRRSRTETSRSKGEAFGRHSQAGCCFDHASRLVYLVAADDASEEGFTRHSALIYCLSLHLVIKNGHTQVGRNDGDCPPRT
jgi:hypothetical protein